ncbi:MAG: nucleotidyltransferase domain-containing protein [Candidatus Aminicenantes bacterium]|nr:nucleotidyltransferase domain-containing protein [Candidatus Aminicenantes bacterium]
MSGKATIDIFLPSNSLRVLAFMGDNPNQEFLGSEIQDATSLSRAGVYLALQELVASGLADKKERGRFHLYSVDHAHPLVKQFKVLKNTVLLEPLLCRLRPSSIKVILFGSASRGEDSSSSDVDIFILTRDPETIRELITSFSCGRKIQSVVVAPAQSHDFREKNTVFWGEIDRGIVLWEEQDEPGVSRLSEEREDKAFFQRKITGRKRTRIR